MPEVETVDPQKLLSVFFERIAKDSALNGNQVRALVRESIQKVAENGEIQGYLHTYRESGIRDGTIEEDSYSPFITLCNGILEKVRAGSLKSDLDTALKGEDVEPVQFLRHAEMYPARDWKSEDGQPELAPIKPDIVLVRKDSVSVRQYIQDQERAKPGSQFDPSKTPSSEHEPGLGQRKTCRIKMCDILCCGEVKWERALNRGRGPKGAPAIHADVGEGSSGGAPKGKGRAREGRPHKLQRVSLSSSQGFSPASSERSTTHQSQLAHYAAEMLSCGPYATQTLGMTFDYDEFQFSYFDRQNTITTKKFDIFHDFELFVAFLITFSRFSLEDWGIEARFYPKEDQIEIPIGAGDTTVRINTTLMPLCHRVALLGRGTMVLRGDLIANGTQIPVAIKISYPEAGRVAEQDFIHQGYGLDNGEIRDYLPRIYASEDPPFTTGGIRRQLGLEEKGQTRQRRIIIFEYLEGIATLGNPTDFATAWRDCFLSEIYLYYRGAPPNFVPIAHRVMWKEHLEHGDLSLDNLMYRRKNGKILGVLIDWDLATMRGAEDEVFGGGTRRTGTAPFVSLDLITSKPSRRKYRHDAESLGWTLRFGCIDLNHRDNIPLIKGWLDPKSTKSVREDSLSRGEDEKYKLQKGFQELFKLSGAFLLKLSPKASTSFLSDPHTPALTGNIYDLFGRSVKPGWRAPQLDEPVELNEEKVWELCEQTLRVVFG